MSDVIPVLLFLCLAGTFTLVPLLGPRRAQRHCREALRALQARYGFTPEPAGHQLSELSSLPPFHYGRRRRVVDPVRGAFAGLPTEVFGYTCEENGTAHWYLVAMVRLGRTLPPFEVQHEPVFTSSKVHYTWTDDRQETGVAEFDATHRAASPDERLSRTLITPGLARTLMAAPETFDLRIEGGLLVLWRRDGWSDSGALVDCCLTAVHALVQVLDLDPDQFDSPRSIPGQDG